MIVKAYVVVKPEVTLTPALTVELCSLFSAPSLLNVGSFLCHTLPSSCPTCPSPTLAEPWSSIHSPPRSRVDARA